MNTPPHMRSVAPMTSEFASPAELPVAIDAEQAVLGGLMIQPSSLAQIKDWLLESDFYRHDHQLIYRAIYGLIGRGDPVDAVTLSDWFDKNGLAGLIGGSSYLYALDAATPSAANIVAHAKIVLEKSQLRAAIELGEGLNGGILQGDADSHTLLANARANFERLATRTVKLDPLSAALSAMLVPFTADELKDAVKPHEHVFQAADVGMFPIGEVTLIAAAGREGKTFCEIGFACALVRGQHLCGLVPTPDRSVVIYSAEDDRKQYARKVAAQKWLHGDGDWTKRIIVPDLNAPGVAEWRELVRIADRRPESGPVVNAIIVALWPLMNKPSAPGLLIFETASTLTQADEDNAGHKTLIGALRHIARALNVAVVLVHHTSQAAGANLPTLNLAATDIRGATALTANSRQCFQLVNLGSKEDPHPANDARTALRELVAPTESTRLSALICLDSSKAIDPPPVFFRWRKTEFGPALEEITPPASIQGKCWRKVRQMLNGRRADERASAKQAEVNDKVKNVVAAVKRLQREGVQSSARAVSTAAGRNAGWADRYLALAVEQRMLATRLEKIPRTRGETTVYYIPDNSWMDKI
jgi:hypothetical protein